MTLTGSPGKVVTPEPEPGLEAVTVTGAGPATRPDLAKLSSSSGSDNSTSPYVALRLLAITQPVL